MRTLRLVIATTVNAPLDDVYAVLSDLPRYPQFFRYMHDLRVLEQRDHTVLAEVVEDMFGIKVMKVLTKFTFNPPVKLLIEQVKGPFAKAVAWFDLEPEGDKRTRVVHGAEITVDGLLGSIGMMLLRSGKAKARMTEELKAVKREAEKLAAASKPAT
ncbi:MAG: SRPBCC family protein [Armatimonadetes bacterium]|nr:SRPBCC family protein [Armatimonadota bacterium]MCX7968373.1 SRPBCC family protein [Armatimonadota bacterium]MDW8142186.1 SRPBCC family protein [Armatimonadota bacterium]